MRTPVKTKWLCWGIKRTCVKKAVMLTVVLNALQLLIYLMHSWGGENVPFPSIAISAPEKPWPHLPSFTSWAPKSNIDPVSCEAFFGNGFTQTFRIFESELPLRMNLTKKSRLFERNSFIFRFKKMMGAWTLSNSKQSQGDEARLISADVHTQPLEPNHIQLLREGLFHCFYSETLRTSICEGINMVMNPEKITMANGGEPLESVIGRNEEEELPYFTTGAFQIIVSERGGRKPLFNKTLLQSLMPQGIIQDHTMQHLFENIHTIPFNEVMCAHIITEPTVVVTRFEYANLFHTVTDWYSAYMTARVTNLKQRPHVVFVDGHCKSTMDDGWEAMFSGLNYAKHLAGPICFNHLIFAPLGYDTPLFKGISQSIFCQGCSASNKEKDSQYHTHRLREFGEMFTSAFNLSSATHSPKKPRVAKVLFVRREDYLAHPRHTGKPESRLSNEEEVLDALKTWASHRASDELDVTVVNGLFAHMSMEEQLQEVQESSIIVGAHGAGLSHLLFARPEKTAVLELVSPYFKRPHFQAMSQWMGMKYHAIEMKSSKADCSEVTYHVNNILSGLLEKHAIS